MDRTAFLGTFRRHLDDLEKFQGFIDKAKSQQGKFAASIVEKVINDNTAKVQTLAETIMPLTADVESEIGVLGAERDSFATSRAAEAFEVEVLELRLAIGEIDQPGFAKASAAGRESLTQHDTLLAGIDVELGHFREVADRWSRVGEAAGLLTPAPTKSKKSERAPAAAR